ncbi:DUF1684 domain-containing protein [Stenotrophomonas pavanii]|uniref:DUF1684 domain-containing protein n=1 Tax=Stenotrophomonas TaxID=40323 RepID=UPI000709164C|nr:MULTISPECIES: DUF1684 domain-containing protein [Stenotrophomonas]MBN5152191.1 DUF1684 domain-containing protein [Stenotrophomonas maltophilia]TGR45005.1 DUF1684 domain-containing protein [bacterium M00.F.Ca.ET.199.01.1.1]TGT03781.1 DUF1684 domain-containing protein [bacterium M00.F.Ca.ET.177.01.1.1]TGT58300.1 DUF1684 domain-containing protein [Mesorhizobium sp. M00.F.Ca.ET.170.01.1.1]TGU08228.1 DUF1684 domain-containing protein [bacterium M00.F.Ca.ET.163.01.1.1]TGU92282.1 DUF1684 domain-c
MRYRGMAGLLAAWMLAACSPAPPAAPAVTEDPAYAAAQQQWRVARYQDLTRPDGWTALVGLHWLQNTSHFVGSGATNGIRLAVGPDKLGLLRREGTQWWFTPETGVDVSHEGQPVRGRIRVDTDKDAQPTLLAFDGGKGQLSIIRRGPRDALRVKHADAAARRDFAGLQYWPGGADWQVQARFIAHPPGKTIPIVDITGLTTEMPNAGAVEFERDGRSWRLEAIGAPGQPLFLIFADRTSGHGSYPAGRYLDTDAPAADGTLRIDFNHAYNPPCAFTAYATCPLAPPENRLDLRVEAGEKAYHLPEGEG